MGDNIVKKRIGLMSILILLFVSSSVYGFTDIKEGAWYYKDVQLLKSHNIIGGYADGSFKPQNNITNGEALKLILGVLDIPELAGEPGSHWATGLIYAANDRGLISDNDFEPNVPITRGEVAEILAKGLKAIGAIEYNEILDYFPAFEDIEFSEAVYTTVLYHEGLIGGVEKPDGMYYLPDSKITRAELSSIIVRTMKLLGTEVPVVKPTPTLTPPIITNSLIKPIPILSLQDLPRAALTKSDFEEIILYMGQNSKYDFTIGHNGISMSRLDKETSQIGRDAMLDMLARHPEYLAYITSYSRNITGTSTSSASEYKLENGTFDNSQLQIMQNTFEKKVISVLENLIDSGKITKNMTDYEKAKVIFEWVVFNTEYDSALGAEGFGGYGQIVNGKASCQGYTARSE